MTASVPEFDLVIVGSGIAGSALACALRASDLRVLLIEGGRFPQQPPDCENALQGFDARVSALTLGSKDFLETLGVWPVLTALRAEGFAGMQVWDAEGTAAIGFDAAEVNASQLGYIVENRVLVYALLDALGMSANIKLLDDTQLLGITRQLENGVASYQLQLDKNRQVRTALVVGADGANSFVRQTLGFKTREWDYPHHAIVCTVQMEKPHQHKAWQRFMPTGPVALLPLSASDNAHFCSIVWSVIPQEAERLMQLSDDEFAQALTQATESCLGKVLGSSRRYSFPLRQRHAIDYVQEGVALVADAAHTIHPLAGQGINLGLQDVRVLAEELLRARAARQGLGDMRVLSRYQRRRKADNLLMMAVMEGFQRLFGQSSLLLRWVRNRGMAEVARHPLLKKQLIKQAMGLK